MNIIILLVLFFLELNKIKADYSIYFLLLSFIQYVLYSLEDILNKVALTNLFIFPESLLFYKGIYSLIYFVSFTALIFASEDLMPLNEELFPLYHLIIRLCFIIFNIIRSIYLVRVIDHFSSQHISILKVLEAIIL